MAIDTSNGNYTYSQSLPMTAASGVGLTKTGPNMLTLSNSNGYTGPTLVTGGTLNVAAGGSLNGITYNEVTGGVLNIAGSVTAASGGMFGIGSGYSSATTGTVTINSGALNIGNGGGCTYIGGKINNTGTAGAGTFNINGGTVTVAAPGSGGATYGDATRFWLNPYANGGACTINLNGGLLTSARPISDGGSGGSYFDFSGGTLQAAVSSTLFLNTQTNYVNSGGAFIDTQGFAATIATALQHGTGTPDGGLTKVGTGTLTLAAADTYTGNTLISAGTLTLGNNLALQNSPFNTASTGTLAFSSGINTPTFGGLTGTNNLTLASNVTSLTLNPGSGFTQTYSGNLGSVTAGMSVIKTGAGTQVLSGSDTYTGSTILTAGTLNLGSSAALAGGGNISFNGGSLQFSAANTTDYSTRILSSTGAIAIDTNGLTVTLGGGLNSSNSGGLTKLGAGTLILSGPNTYSGSTTLSVGQLNINSATALGAGSGTFIISAGTIDNTSSGPVTLTNNNPQTWNSSFTFLGSNNLNLGSGAVTLGVSPTVTVSSGTLTVGGISGAYNLTKAGSGMLSLAGSDTYTGTTNANAGTLNIAAGGSLNNSNVVEATAGGVLTISGSVTIPANGAFAVGSGVGGTGTVVVNSGAVLNLGGGSGGKAGRVYVGGQFDGNGVNGTGVFTINGGLVNVAVGGAGTSGDATTFWLNPWNPSGATLNLNGGTLSTARVIQDGANGAAPVHFNGGTLQAAGSITLISAVTADIDAGGGTIDTQGYSATIGQAMLHGTGSPDGGLTKVGSGTLVLSSNASTFTGNMTISAGTLNVTAGGLGTNATTSALGNPQISGRTITVGAGAEISFTNAHDVMGNAGSAPLVQLAVNGGTIMTDGHLITLGPLALNNGSVVASNSAAFGYGYDLNGAVTVTGGTSTMTSVGSVYHLNDTGTYVTPFDVAAGATLQISGSLVNNWSGNASGVTKTDAGMMLLSGTNTYTGVTTVNGGVLEAASIASLPGYNTAGKLSVGASGTLALSAGSWTSANVGALVSSNSGNFAAGAQLAVDTTGGSLALSTSPLAGNMGLITMGTNVLNLGLANTNSGATTLSAGTLQIGNALALQNSTVIPAGGALDMNGFNATAGGLSGSGNLTLNSGTLNVGNNAVNTTYSGNLGGSVPVNKIGGGMLTLTASNSYAGPMTVSAGRLYVNGSLNSASGVNVSSGTLGGTGSIGPVTVNSGGIDAGLLSSGSLTAGSLAFTNTATIHVSDNQSSAPLNVIGALTANGASGSVTINMDSGIAVSGIYDLVSFGSLGGTTGSSAFAIGTHPTTSTRQTGTLQDTGSMLVWTVVGGTPIWTGANGSAFVGGNNWKLSTDNSVTDFEPGDSCLFDDTAQSFVVDTSAAGGNLSPLSLTFSATSAYTLQGTYGVSGSANLVKNSSGVLLITNSNNYYGGTAMNGGVLQIGNSAALGTGPLTMSTGTLSSYGGTAYAMANNTAFTGNVTLGDPVNNGLLTLSGSVGLNGGSPTLTINSPVAISGVVSNGGFVQSGSGTLLLSNANTYAAGTTLNSGVLQVGNNSALGSGPVTLNGGALTSNGATARTLANTINVAGNTTLGDPTNNGALVLSGSVNTSGSPVLTISSSVSVTGAVNLSSGTTTLGVNAPSTISGVISGGGVTKAGSGLLTVTNTNTFSGNLVISGGTFIDATPDEADSNTPTATGVGNMMIFGRTITINSGAMLRFNSSDAMGAYQYNSPVTLIANGGTIGNATGAFMSLPSITLENGGMLLTGNGANPAYQSFNLRGSVTVSGTSGSFITAGAAGNNGVHLGGTTIPATTFNVAATGDPTADLTVSVPLLNEVYNTGSLIKAGAGLMTLTASNNSYTGSTLVTGGTLDFAAGSALPGTSQINAVNGSVLAISGSVTVANNGVFAIGSSGGNTGTVNVNSGAVLNIGYGSTAGTVGGTYIGGKINNAGTAGTGTLNVNGGVVNVAVAGTATGGDGSSLWLDPWGGSGSTINLNGGTLSTARQIANGSSSAAYINFNGGTLQAAANNLNLILSNGYITASVQAGGAIIDTQGYNTTINQAFVHGGGTPDGGLTKIGSGMLTLSASSNYTGGTTISNGTLSVTNDNQLGATSGSLAFGGGSLLVGGAGTSFTSARSLTLNAATTIDSGNAANTVVFNGPAAIGANTLTLQGAGNATYGGNIGGSGNLFKTAAGAWTLSGPQGYGGATTVNAGKLVLGPSASLSTSGISVSSAATLAAHPATGATVTGGGGLSLANGATLDMSSDNNAGTLAFSGPLSLGNGLGGATLKFDVGTSGGNTVTDLLTASGAASVSGTNTIDLVAFGASSLSINTPYNLITAANGLSGGTFVLGTPTFTVNGMPYVATLDNTDTAEQVVFSQPTLTWTGWIGGTSSGTASGTWDVNTTNNWANGNSPATFTAGNIAQFGDVSAVDGVSTVGANSITIAAGGVNPAALVFSASATNYTITSSDAIGIYGATTGITLAGSGTVTLVGSNSYGGATVINNGVLVIGDNSSLGASTAPLSFGNAPGGKLMLALSSTGNMDVSARIANSTGVISIDTNGNTVTFASSLPASNTGGLTVNSSVPGGVLVLAASNAYSGATNVNSGVLRLQNNAAVPAASSLAVAAGGDLQLPGGFSITAPALALNGGTLENSGGANTWGSAITLGGPSSVLASAGTLTVSTALGNGGNLLTVSGAGNTVFGGIISGAGGMTKTGTGLVVLSAANTFSGPTTINAGTIQIGDGSTQSSNYGLYSGSGTGTITVNSGGTLLFRSIDAFGTNGATKNIAITVEPGGLVTNGLWLGQYTSGGTTAGFNTLYNLHLSGGTLRTVGALYGNNTYLFGAFNLTGTVTVDGTVQSTISAAVPGNPDYLGPNGVITLNNGTAVYNVLHNTSGIDLLVTAALNNYDGGPSGLTKTGAGLMVLTAANGYTGTTTISGGTLQLGNDSSGESLASTSISIAGGATLAFNQADMLTFAPAGGITGAGNLVAEGPGTLIVAGSNNYSGGATVIGGTLKLGNSAALPLNGALAANGGTLDLAGYSVTAPSFSGANGTVTNSGGALATLAVNQSINTSFNGTLTDGTGKLALSKSGAGILTLGSASTYSGGTTIAAGVLQVGNAAALGTGNLAVNGGTLDMAGVGATVASLSGASGVVTNNAAGTLATLSVNQSAGTVFNGAINDGAGQAGLYKTGPGTLTLNNTNAYSGPTTVGQGLLYAGVAGALSTSSAFTIDGGTLDASAGSQTIGSLTMNGGALNLAVGNLLTSMGTATFAGTLNVSNFNFSTGTAELMTYANDSGTFTSVDINGAAMSGAYQLAYLPGALEILPGGPPLWTSTSGGSWTTGSNWNGGKAPGTAAGQQAVVGTGTTSQVTITLDSPQTLGVLTFANSGASNAGYTLTAGASGSLTMATSDGSAAQIVVNSGSHMIDATVNVTLTGSLTIAPSTGSTLEIDGNMSESISGSGSLLVNDAGTLILGGSNGFTGGTVVTDGTLVLTNNNSLYRGTSLTIGDPAAFAGGPSGAGADTGVDPQGGYPGSRLDQPLAASPSITPVPEPGTLVLLMAGAMLMLSIVFRKSKCLTEH